MAVVKILRKNLIAMWQTLCQIYSRQELYQRSLAVAACVELVAGQFQSGTENICVGSNPDPTQRPEGGCGVGNTYTKSTEAIGEIFKKNF